MTALVFLRRPGLRSLVALADQGAVSGARLAASVLVGRAVGADGLGTFTLAFTVLVLAETALEAVVTLPYTVFSQSAAHDARGGALGNAFRDALTLAVALAIAVVAGGAWAWASGDVSLGAVLLVVAGLLPARLAMEFGRRVAFAEHRADVALAMDLAMAVVFVGGLGLGFATGRLSVVGAYALYTGACLGPALVWATVRRADLRADPSSRRAGRTAAWRFGRWIAGSRLALAGRETAMPWLLAAASGTAATGLFEAAAKVVGLTTPLVSGLANVLTPSIAAAHAQRGAAGVRAVVRRATIQLTAAVFAAALALAAGGDWLLGLLYGDAFGGQQTVVALFALAMVAEAAGVPSDAGLWAIGRPSAGFAAQLAGLVVAAGTGVLLVPAWGVLGAVAALGAGKGVATALQVGAFVRLTRPVSPR